MLILRAFRSAASHLNQAPSRIKHLNSHRLMGLQRKSGASSDTSDRGDEEDVPLKYSESPALHWKARDSRTGGRIKNDRLWYEPFVVIASVAVFMFYFTILREENDVDDELTKSLYNRVPGLEEQQLMLVLEHNERSGLDSTEVKKRLMEIAEERRKAAGGS